MTEPAPSDPVAPTQTAVPTEGEAGAGCLEPSDRASFVRFGPDGVLGAYVLGDSDRLVVIGHQTDGNSCQVLAIARELVANDFSVMAIDFTGRPGSRAAGRVGARPYPDDMAEAYRWALDDGYGPIALMGVSIGGYASLGAASTADDPPDAVVSVSAPDEYRADRSVPPDVSRLDVPILLMAAEDDGSFAEAAHVFADQQPDAELVMVPGRLHGSSLLGDPDHPEYLEQVIDFLDANLTDDPVSVPTPTATSPS